MNNKVENIIMEFFNLFDNFNFRYSNYDEQFKEFKKFTKKLKPLGFVIDYSKLNELLKETIHLERNGYTYHEPTNDYYLLWQKMVDEFVKLPDVAHCIKNPLEYAMRKFQTKEKNEEFLNWALNWENESLYEYYDEEENNNNKFHISEKALLSYTKFFMYRATDEEFKVLPKLFDHAETFGNMPFDIKFYLEFLRKMVLSSSEEQDKFIKERYPYLVKLGFNINSYYHSYHGSMRTQFKYVVGLLDWKGGIDIPLHSEGETENILFLDTVIKRIPASKPILDFLLKCPDINVNQKSLSKWTHGHLDEAENPTSGNTPLHQIVRIGGYTNDKMIDDYFDLFIKKGAKIDAVNDRGESILASAIHHGYIHGVDACKDLIYPEILHDMAKLDGISEWISIDPKIREILYEKYPYMTDNNDMTYSEFLSFIKDQKISQQTKADLLNFPNFLNRLFNIDYKESYGTDFFPNAWESYSASFVNNFYAKELVLRKPWLLTHNDRITIKLNKDFEITIRILDQPSILANFYHTFCMCNNNINKNISPDFIETFNVLTKNKFIQYKEENHIDQKVEKEINNFILQKKLELLSGRHYIYERAIKNYWPGTDEEINNLIQKELDHYDKREEKVINFLYGDDRETYLKEYEMYKTNDEFFEKLQTVETRYNQLGDKINNDGLPF